MLAEIVNAFVEMSKHTQVVASHVCKYCGKAFVRESTLTTHMCERKRRFTQEKEQGVQLGFQAYLQFYQTTQGNSRDKNYEDFVNSDFYIAFVKYGRYQVGIRTVNFSSFTSWLLKNNKKLDQWTKEEFYVEWLKTYLTKESIEDALERGFNEMQNYADNDATLSNDFSNYFRHGSKNRIVEHIRNGRISPWIVYNCDSGIDFLDNLNAEQIDLILPWIDPECWQKKFKDNGEEIRWLKSVLKESGL